MTAKFQSFIVWSMVVLAGLISLSVLFSGHFFLPNATFNGKFEAYALVKDIILCVFLIIVVTLIAKISHKYHYFVRLLLWLLIISVVAGALIYQPYAPVYDSMAVNVQVYRLLQPESGAGALWSHYFSTFPNNVPITVFLFWLDSPFKSIVHHFDDLLLLHAIFGQLLLLFSIYHLAKIIDVIFGKRVGNTFLLFCLFMPTYLMQFTQIAYSDTFALPFLIVGVIFAIAIFDHQAQHKYAHMESNYWLTTKNIILSALFLAISIFLRPNVIVVILALSIILIIFYARQWRLMLALICALAVFSFSTKAVANVTLSETHYQKVQDKNSQMPIESWFLTAYYLGGRSGNEINAITDKYHNYDQRKAYIREKLFEKFAALKLTGIIRTWHNKINVLFGIKTDFGMQYFNSFRKKSDVQAQKKYLKIYHQLTPKMIHLSTITVLTAVLSLFMLPIYYLFKNNGDLKNEQQRYAMSMLLMTFEALTLFYVLFWEVQEHYIYMMLPFLLAIGAILSTFLADKILSSMFGGKKLKGL